MRAVRARYGIDDREVKGGHSGRDRERLRELGLGRRPLIELAHAVQAAAGRTAPPRHVPRPMLRLMANTLGRVKPELGRQARASLAMDQTDLTFDAAPIHIRYPDLPSTRAAELLAAVHRTTQPEEPECEATV